MTKLLHVKSSDYTKIKDFRLPKFMLKYLSVIVLNHRNMEILKNELMEMWELILNKELLKYEKIYN